MNLYDPRDERGYVAVADHGLWDNTTYLSTGIIIKLIVQFGRIGNLRTAALVSLDGSSECSNNLHWMHTCWIIGVFFYQVESYCVPNFDSPSIFARILDKDKGGHFSVTPTIPFSTKQNYLPSSNVSISLLKVSAATMVAFLCPTAAETKLRPCIYLPLLFLTSYQSFC